MQALSWFRMVLVFSKQSGTRFSHARPTDIKRPAIWRILLNHAEQVLVTPTAEHDCAKASFMRSR